LPHADPELFAQGHAGQPFRQLAAGPARQLAGALVFPEKATEFKIEVDLTAEMTVINPFDFFVEPYADSFPFAYTDDLKTELAPISRPTTGPLLKYLAGDSARGAEHGQLPGRSQRATAEEDPLHHPHGAGRADPGRDAGARLRLLPRLGLAAGAEIFRISGSPPASSPAISSSCGRHRSGRGPREVENDFTDLHAWAEVYLPGAGWIGFDVTSGLLCGEGHIPVAATPHYRSAAPITGAVGRQCRIRLRDERQAASASAAHHPPVLRRAWARLDALGEQVDADLKSPATCA
jgi:hypothetical protein